MIYFICLIGLFNAILAMLMKDSSPLIVYWLVMVYYEIYSLKKEIKK